jgi:bacterial/archaeal transporter family-2 protein
MTILILILILFIISFVSQTMTPIQARCGQILGVTWATAIYLVTGAVASGSLLIASGESNALLTGMHGLPYYVYVNALFNVLVLIGIVTLVPKVGVGTAWAAGVVGRFSSALLFDHFGALNLVVDPLNIQKIAGATLVILGSFYFTKRKEVASLEPAVSAAHEKKDNVVPGWAFWGALALGVAIGASQTLMFTINAEAGQIVGVTGAVTVYLVLGAVLALLVSTVSKPEGAKAAFKLSPYYYLPGIVNVFIVGLPTVLIPMVGVGVFTAVSFAAMAVASMFFDRLGLLGMPKVSLTATRVMGAAIMLVGVLVLRLAQA